MSQMVGVQAVSNVLRGSAKNVPKNQAYFPGSTVVHRSVDPDLQKRILGDQDRIQPLLQTMRGV